MKTLDLSQTEFSLVLSMMLFTTDRSRINNDEKSKYSVIVSLKTNSDLLPASESERPWFGYFSSCRRRKHWKQKFVGRWIWTTCWNAPPKSGMHGPDSNLIRTRSRTDSRRESLIKVLKVIRSEKSKITNTFSPKSSRYVRFMNPYPNWLHPKIYCHFIIT